MKNKKIIIVLALFIFPVLFFNCSESEEPVKESNEIWIQDGSFVPDEKEIVPGTEITWINKTDKVQTVTSGVPGFILFDSGEIQPGKSFTFEFNDVGPVQYYSKTDADSIIGILTIVPQGVQE